MKKKQYEYVRKNMTEKQFASARFRQIAYFFLAWNAFGIAVWQFVKRKKTEENPDWNKLDSTQQYLSLMYDPLKSNKITKVQIHGLSSITTETMTREEFLRPRDNESQDKEKMTGSDEEKID